MNVGVGSTNGWFPDGQGKKPWLNHAQSMFVFFLDSSSSKSLFHSLTHSLTLLPRNRSGPARDFITAIDQWYPTWPTSVEDRAMIV